MTQTPDLEGFCATLEQLPPHGGVVFRGCEARSHERWAGRAHVTETLLSTSRDPRVATENFSTEAVYAILSRAGRGSSSSRQPVTSTRSSSCRARSSRWSRA